MAAINYTEQLIYVGGGYIDAKMQPVATIADLNKIPRSQRFIGLTVTVLDDGYGKPQDYWIEKNVTIWVKKNTQGGGSADIPISGDDVETKDSINL